MMKKAMMGLIAAMMAFSLAACTPTTEKNKTGEVKELPTAAESTAAEKRPDPNAPVLDVVSIYTVSEDGSKIEGTMDAVEELNENTLVELLIQYGVLDEGTKANSFTADGEAASQEVGPGAASDAAEKRNVKESGVLDLNQFPDTKNEMLLQAVANTFIENMGVTYMTISVEGEVVGENLPMATVGK